MVTKYCLMLVCSLYSDVLGLPWFMTWQSALWEISLHQTTSAKMTNTGEKRQVTVAIKYKTTAPSSCLLVDTCGFFSASLPGSNETSNSSSARGTQTGSLWTVGGILHSLCVLEFMDNNWNAVAHPHLSYLQEYETQSTQEARLVKEFDLLEMILQAHEYEELEGTPGRLQEFFDSTNGTPKLSLLLSLSVSILLKFVSVPVVTGFHRLSCSCCVNLINTVDLKKSSEFC